MSNSKNVTAVKETKKVNVSKKESAKIDLLQMSEAIKSNVKDKKDINKESIYLYLESEISKANDKLNSFVDKNKGKDIATSEKRKLKLSFHLSGARTKIRSQFERLIISYFELVGKNKLSDSQNKELINLTFVEFFESRFAKFKKGNKIYSDMFCNVNNSLNKKVDLICKIYNS